LFTAADFGRLFSSSRVISSGRPDHFALLEHGPEPALSVGADGGRADGNPKISTVFWRNLSDLLKDLDAAAD
jgi:hypothetical protein